MYISEFVNPHHFHINTEGFSKVISCQSYQPHLVINNALYFLCTFGVTGYKKKTYRIMKPNSVLETYDFENFTLFLECKTSKMKF